MDLSQIRVVTYYPNVDSTGKQAVREEIFIDKNVTTSVANFSKKGVVIQQNSGSVEQIQQEAQIGQSIDVKERQTRIPIKYYIIGFILFVGVGYLTFKLICHYFF